jgi:hypothetical protein
MNPQNTITHASAIADIRRLIAAGTNLKTKPPELVGLLHQLKGKQRQAEQ